MRVLHRAYIVVVDIGERIGLSLEAFNQCSTSHFRCGRVRPPRIPEHLPFASTVVWLLVSCDPHRRHQPRTAARKGGPARGGTRIVARKLVRLRPLQRSGLVAVARVQLRKLSVEAFTRLRVAVDKLEANEPLLCDITLRRSLPRRGR